MSYDLFDDLNFEWDLDLEEAFNQIPNQTHTSYLQYLQQPTSLASYNSSYDLSRFLINIICFIIIKIGYELSAIIQRSSTYDLIVNGLFLIGILGIYSIRIDDDDNKSTSNIGESTTEEDLNTESEEEQDAASDEAENDEE
ncbi:putative membrane protein [Wickerhamomyces ciferrii]|uniref:Membrane protein n=1 Tax=Wickerhamomyces ciferrii (strain ATCC 14091 / BCRC 22168 / CBS 111 / JCM 3599 / NBRC 0793 / NRRL Y-1031 F-60-10) TaxID=1206466 RepID=K0KR02_WICCF|nr:uncharacterized protein BN7_3283 [Wickerhamomyces ciferrii]CCH43729.1 putative membrane protein [Wickerhamomyces ciferrii]